MTAMYPKILSAGDLMVAPYLACSPASKISNAARQSIAPLKTLSIDGFCLSKAETH